MLQLLKTYKNRLINLTSANKSLLHLRISKENDIDFKEFDFLNNEQDIKLLEKIIKGNKVKICNKNDSRNEKSNEISVWINKIARKEKFITEERGSNDLFVGFPYVEGKFNDGTLCRCPLLFFPVHLQLSTENKWELECTEDFFINKSFLLAYSHYNDTKLTDDFIENSLESIDKSDFISFLNSFYQYLKESPLEINFNRELFEQKLDYFTDYKKADFELKHGIGELKLSANCVLGVFPKTDSYLTPDYEELIGKAEFETIEELFEKRTHHYNALVKEENICTAYPIDASQERAIIEVKKGKSLVIQGPPGSGKSQLICNLISDFTSKGKKVLVVSQKRAALDVVESRLKEKNIENFIANVHDFRNDRKALFHKIEAQIEAVEDYKKANSTLDAIYIEREFVEISRKIEFIVNQLDVFKNSLYAENEYGISVKELYLAVKNEKLTLEISLSAKKLNKTSLETLLKKFETILFYQNQIQANNFNNRKSLSKLSKNDIHLVKNYFELLVNYPLRHFPEILQSANLKQMEGLVLIENSLKALSEKSNAFPEILKNILDSDFSANDVKKAFKKIESCFKKPIENTIEIEKVNEITIACKEYLLIENSLLKTIWWKLTSSNKKIIENYVGLNFNKEQVEQNLAKLENRLALEQLIVELQNQNFIINNKHLQPEYFKETENTYLAIIDIINQIKADFSDYHNLFKNIGKLSEISALIEGYKSLKNNALDMFSENQIAEIINNSFPIESYIDWLNKNFDFIIESDKIIASFNEVENEIYNQVAPITSQLISTLENEIKLCWITDLEHNYPELLIAYTGKISLLEKELQENIKKKNELSTQIWQLRLRENTYRELKHNRLLNTVTYRELKHQVSKKRSLWPIRKLVATHSDEIFNLIPCWLVSPETVSAIFPLVELFDIVIFDEASQCYAEKGIPSIYRGKQVVIAGDSKQLQPSDLYQIRWEQEEENTILEIDSLLDFSRQFLPEHALIGHYRSNSFDLIAFSNTHFYHNKLSLIPNIDTLNNYKPAIDYIKINGTWKNNTNTEEAEKIVEIIFKLLSEGIKNIGIVTFNHQQQSHIQDILENNTKGYPLPEDIFVKNIENIQGDERDVIIFSVGYAPDSAGRLSAKFGSLNLQNGENRLNVAITRAKQKIIIVSSILPSDLDVENTQNEGPKLFKKYLEYALKVSNNDSEKLWSLNEANASKYNSLVNCIKTNTQKPYLPFSDLVEMTHSKFGSLIYTDDNLFYLSSAKEYYAYLPISVKKCGWEYKRVFSKQYFQNN